VATGSGVDENGVFLPLEALPDDYAKSQAYEDGVVVDDYPHPP
jgi:hypothetical protein